MVWRGAAVVSADGGFAAAGGARFVFDSPAHNAPSSIARKGRKRRHPGDAWTHWEDRFADNLDRIADALLVWASCKAFETRASVGAVEAARRVVVADLLIALRNPRTNRPFRRLPEVFSATFTDRDAIALLDEPGPFKSKAKDFLLRIKRDEAAQAAVASMLGERLVMRQRVSVLRQRTAEALAEAGQPAADVYWAWRWSPTGGAIFGEARALAVRLVRAALRKLGVTRREHLDLVFDDTKIDRSGDADG